MHSLSSLCTISSRGSDLPGARKTYAKVKSRHDSEEGSGTSDPPYSHGTTPSQHSSSSTLLHRPLRRRCHDKRNGARNHDDIPPNLLSHFSHATTITTGHDDSNSGSNRSLGAHQSSLDIRVPFPSTGTSEELYPSPHSADAIAVFEAPLEKGEAQLFDGPVKYHDILGDQVQYTFVEAYDGTNTSTSTTSIRSPSGRRGLLVPLKRRAGALASSVLPTRFKFPTIFHKGRYPPYPADDDNNSVEYDIPCLAYITCLW